MLMMVAFFALTNALNNVEAVLVPLLAHRVLHLASWQFGILSLASGGGALAGSWLAARVFRDRSVRWAFVSMGVFGGMIIGLGLSHTLAMLGGFYLVLGLSFAVTEVITSTLWQVLVPDAVRGQVMGALSTVARAANPAGYVLAGALDEWLGIRGGLMAGGLAIILLSTVVVWNRAISRLDEASNSPKEGSMVQSS
jgi:MFS family permease